MNGPTAERPAAGPWFVHENKGTGGWLAGFYVGREVKPGVNEWLPTNGGIRPFVSESAARAAIVKAKA